MLNQSVTYRYSFFTDPTISTLTSGTLNQNTDLGSVSFPRRIGVRFDTDYVAKYGLMGMQVRWSSYADKKFENDLGEAFCHTDMVTRNGWAMYYFDGIYPKDIAYIKLEVLNPSTGMLIQTFYFEFRKSYQTSLDARYYIEDPVLHEKIVKNGILTELRRGRTASGDIRFKRARSTFKQQKVRDIFSDNPVREPTEMNIITQTKVRYTEKPKMMFLVTPPHLIQAVSNLDITKNMCYNEFRYMNELKK